MLFILSTEFCGSPLDFVLEASASAFPQPRCAEIASPSHQMQAPLRALQMTVLPGLACSAVKYMKVRKVPSCHPHLWLLVLSQRTTQNNSNSLFSITALWLVNGSFFVLGESYLFQIKHCVFPSSDLDFQVTWIASLVTLNKIHFFSSFYYENTMSRFEDKILPLLWPVAISFL